MELCHRIVLSQTLGLSRKNSQGMVAVELPELKMGQEYAASRGSRNDALEGLCVCEIDMQHAAVQSILLELHLPGDCSRNR